MSFGGKREPAGLNSNEVEKSQTGNTSGSTIELWKHIQNMGPNKEEKIEYDTPNRGNNIWRNNGNQIGMMRNGNTPSNAGNNEQQNNKRPWERNNSMVGNNGSPSFSGNPNDMSQGPPGSNMPPGQKRPWDRNSNTFDNNGSPGFSRNPSNFNQGPGRRSLGQQGRDFHITEKLKEISENLNDLEPKTETRRKFSNQARLWIGNIPLASTEDQLKELFTPYGEFDEFYFDKNKGFAFVRMDYKDNARKAQVELNKKTFHGRELRIRLSPTPGTALKVRNLSPFVTTELLEKVFEVFGEIERVTVSTDDRGNSVCEGVVEYCKKATANNALRACQEGCLYLTASLRPVIVELMPLIDDSEGMGELNVNRRETRYFDERQSGPRLPLPGSFEDEFGKRWKKLYESYDLKKKDIEIIMKEESKNLDMQMELARQQHETEMLRQQLREKEETSYLKKQEFEQQQRQMGGYDKQANEYESSYPKYEESNYPKYKESNYPKYEESNYPKHEESNYPKYEESNYPKYEDNRVRQSEEKPTYQENSSPQKGWVDPHYDSLYNEPSGPAPKGNFSARLMDFQGNQGGNNHRNLDRHQGGNDLLGELSKPITDQGNNKRSFEYQGKGDYDTYNTPKRPMF